MNENELVDYAMLEAAKLVKGPHGEEVKIQSVRHVNFPTEVIVTLSYFMKPTGYVIKNRKTNEIVAREISDIEKAQKICTALGDEYYYVDKLDWI
jgi:hypothetical protein